MDRQKSHAAAGLVTERKSRRFSLADDEAEEAAANVTDVSDFDDMAAALITLADDEANDDEDEQEASPTIPAPTPLPLPQPTATQTVSGVGRVPAYKKIKLADLFNYPAAGALVSDLEFFWQGGRDGLDAEEEALASETSASESDVASEPSDGVAAESQAPIQS